MVPPAQDKPIVITPEPNHSATSQASTPVTTTSNQPAVTDTQPDVAASTTVPPTSPNNSRRATTPTNPTSANSSAKLPLYQPADIDLNKFNTLVGDWAGKPVEDMRRLFVKQVILDDQTTLDVDTLKVPGFIGISDAVQVKNPQGKSVSGHEDITKFIKQDGLLICTYQWNKERYGTPIDTRRPLEGDLLTEAFIKNEGHHSGAIVPAQRLENGKMTASYGTLNEPDDYHRGLYGKDGYVAVAQRLVFPEFVTAKQARGYTDSIICWMMLMNPFVKFPSNYNGGDPVRIADRASLKEYLKNGVLASLGDQRAIAFLKDAANMNYCAEFLFCNLNSPLYPFTLKGITKLLDGNEQKAKQVLAIRDAHNQRQSNVISQQSRNPEVKAFNIPMPVVPEDLLPLDQLMAQNGQTIAANSIPFPAFKISQIIRRAFRTMLPRHQQDSEKLVQAQARMFGFMEPALIHQLGLGNLPENDPKREAVRQFLKLVNQTLAQDFSSYGEFDQIIDGLMEKADEMLVGAGDRVYFVPPRVYIDLGQNDGDNNLPKGWGFRLETVGALVARGVINDVA